MLPKKKLGIKNKLLFYKGDGIKRCVSRWMLDLKVNREVQFSGMLLTQFHRRGKKKKISFHNNVTKVWKFFLKELLQRR